MNTSRRFVVILFLSLVVSLPALAQENKRFAGGGLSFDYPAAWSISDKSTPDNQHLVLELKGTAAQIMVLVERTASTQPGQRGAALASRTTTFADLMTQEFEKIGAPVQRSDVQTEAGGVMADGLRLRAAPGGQPGSVEVYSFVLGGRIVMITYLRPDSEAAAAAPAWGMIRRSLRVGPVTVAQSPAVRADPMLVPPDNRDMPYGKPATAPAKNVTVDSGKVTGSAYSNNYFKFRMTIPYGWRVQDQDVKNLIDQKGRESIKSTNQNANAQMDASIANTVNLLTVFKYQVGSSQEFNASLICGAQWLDNTPVTASQYIANARRILQSTKDQYYFQPITTESVGGETFAVMEVETAATVKQKYYAQIKNGYALFFIITYVTEEDEAVLKQAMRSLRFV